MKKQILGVAALVLSFNVYASDDNAWMRYAAISPDGSQIAFSFKGDIYTVPFKIYKKNRDIGRGYARNS